VKGAVLERIGSAPDKHLLENEADASMSAASRGRTRAGHGENRRSRYGS
jgi:hypothetical protein